MKNKKEIKDYCYQSFAELAEQYGLVNKTTLVLSRGSTKKNGGTSFNRDYTNAELLLNINTLLESSDDPVKIRFNIYCTIAHEMKHMSILLSDNKDKNNEYADLLTLLEYGYLAKTLRLDSNHLKSRLIDILLAKRILSLNYEFSLPEIAANYDGYTRALEKFQNQLGPADIEMYKNIIDSLTFLKKQMEICYPLDKNPTNSFSLYMGSTYSLIKAKPDLLDKYPILKMVYKNASDFNTPYDLYKMRNETNKELCDDIVTKWLVSYTMDYNDQFNDLGFKAYIEDLIGKYINDTIDFYKNSNKCAVFIDKKTVISDNFRLKKKGVLYLLELAKKYGLNIGPNLVLDSNTMTSTCNLVRTRSHKIKRN